MNVEKKASNRRSNRNNGDGIYNWPRPLRGRRVSRGSGFYILLSSRCLSLSPPWLMRQSNQVKIYLQTWRRPLCCQPLIMQRKAGPSLFGLKKKTPPCLHPAPLTDFLRPVVCVGTGQSHESGLISGRCSTFTLQRTHVSEWASVNVWTSRKPQSISDNCLASLRMVPDVGV